MFYSNLAYLLISLFLVYMLTRKKYNLFHILVFLAPFQSWFFNVGLNLSAFQIVTAIAIVWISLNILVGKKGKSLAIHNKFVIIFLVYAITNTLFISTFIIDDYLNYGGFFRSEGRFIAQIVLLLLTFGILIVASNYVKKIEQVAVYLKTYLHALLLLVALGWIQYVIYNLSGADIFPIGFYSDGTARTGIWTYMGSGIFRISSLGGEPKGLAQSLVIGFFIIHAFNHFKMFFFSKYDKYIKLLFLATVFATLSTSGYVLFVILYIIFKGYLLSISGFRLKIDSKKIFTSFLIIAILGTLIYKNQNFFTTMFDERIAERNITSEDFDAPIQAFLYDNPEFLLFGSGLGNAHNLASDYIPSQLQHYMEDTIFVAKSGYLRLVSELGMTGIMIFFMIFIYTYNNLNLANHKTSILSTYYKALQTLLILLLFAYLARGYVIAPMMLILAMANSIAYSKKFINSHTEKFSTT